MSPSLLTEMQRIFDRMLALAADERGLLLVGVVLLESVFALLWLFIVRRSASA